MDNANNETANPNKLKERMSVRLKSNPSQTGKIRYFTDDGGITKAVVLWDNDPTFKLDDLASLDSLIAKNGKTKSAENSRKTKTEIQKMSIAEILQAIRTKSLTYAEVDDALEEIKEFSKLDRIGDALAKDDLKGK